MGFEKPVIICGAHGGGTSIVTKVLRLNGFFAGEDSGDIWNKRDDKGGSGFTHESDAMVKINCTVLKCFSPSGHDTEMMHLDTWASYLSVLEDSEAMPTVYKNLVEPGIEQYGAGVNPSWGIVKLSECLKEYWGQENLFGETVSTEMRWRSFLLESYEKRKEEIGNDEGRLRMLGNPPTSKPWGWKDPRNSATIPLWKLVFKNPRILFLERPEKENRKHNSPSGKWFCEQFKGKLKEYYYNPPFLEEEDDVFSVDLEKMLKDLHTFNETMKWLGLEELTIEGFKNLMKKADVKYEKL